MPATFIVRGDDYLESERVNSLSGPAEKFFWRLMCAADTHGRMDARPAMLRIKLYGLQLDKIRESDMQRLLLECEQAGLVRSYEVGKKPYLQILRYGQRLRTKSKYPAPPGTTDLPQEDADLQQSAADLPLFAADTQQSAATCRNLPQSAAICRNLPQTCSNPPHEYEYENEYEYEKEKEKENEKEGECINPRSISEPPHTPPTTIFRSLEERESYRHWLRSIKAAHPAGRERATLDHNLHTVAIASFRSAPTAHQHADLLRAFYDSNLDTSTKGRPFKKPMEFRWFLVDLADVIVSAKQWAKETRWKPRTQSKHGTSVPTTTNQQDLATQEETAAFLEDMREALASIGQPPPTPKSI